LRLIYNTRQIFKNLQPNRWDIIVLFIFFIVISLLGSGAEQMSKPYELGEQLVISLDPHLLPSYVLQTVQRMFIALFFSLAFSVIFGMLAARSKQAERIIIPMIDILQSVPVLGFLSITVVGFIALFPNSLLGPECAVIFAIFTAQAWNMALSVYQSFSTVPHELTEVSRLFHLSSWQRFCRVEMPFATPGLLWNTMMSMSGSWFFVVASEAITVSNQNIMLPGIGSYIAVAIKQAELAPIVYATLAMIFIILLYDQLLFRPLVRWSEKFRVGSANEAISTHSWLYTLLKRTKLLRYLNEQLSHFSAFAITASKPVSNGSPAKNNKTPIVLPAWTAYFFNTLAIVLVIFALTKVGSFIVSSISLQEIGHVFLLGAYTGLRIISVLIIVSLIWVPIGIYIGLRPNLSRIIQPLAQLLAAFPANLLFPFFVIIILHYSLNVEIWTTPLMILGTQWYILFNVIAGASTIPKELLQTAQNFEVKGWLWWKRISLPAIFPYYVTGALSAAGGSWNASIVAEVVTWGSTTLVATGLGAYIAQYTTTGDFPRITLGIAVMCIYVVTINRVFWRRLYSFAETRYHLDI